MTEEFPTALLRSPGEEPPNVVSLDWEDGELRWVSVVPDWLEKVGPAGLITQVHQAYAAARPPKENWRQEVSLGDLELSELREFALLLAEARASDPVTNAEQLSVRTSNLESSWTAEGDLLRISDPHRWLATADLQSLCDEFTAVLQRPEIQRSQPSRQVKRLMAFVGKDLQ